MLFDAIRKLSWSNFSGVVRLRRALWLLVAFTWTAVAMLYWQQQHDERVNRLYQLFYWSSIPRWTWICKNKRCERISTSETSIIQSLQTCNMLCASTQLWPQPTGPITFATSVSPVSAEGFTLHIQETTSPEVTKHLKGAFALLKKDLVALEKRGGVEGNMKSLPVDVQVSVNRSTDPRLLLNTDEGYKLLLEKAGDRLVAKISSSSFCGVRHGMETLSQLVWHDPYTGTLLALEGASVVDSPVFHYRGLLLDTARNFFPVADILRTIDAMAANKLNTFHWHATDSQSFPLKLQSVPELAAHGAYGPDAVYTSEDIQTVVRHARLRGIRVVIEMDAPAHVGRAWSWGPAAGLGDLALCVEAEPWRTYCGEPPCGQLNPQNKHVYKVLQKVYAEILQLTGVTDVFHLGGDEVNENCWLKHFNQSKPMELWHEFTQRSLQALVKANGGVPPDLILIWSSQLTNFPNINALDPAHVTVQLWGDSHWEESNAIHHSGFRTIISHVDAWYLDCGFGSWFGDSGSTCGDYHTWQHMYKHRPWGLPNSQAQILGGVVCQWTEQVGPEDLDTRIWPRAAAFAERLWTDAYMQNDNDKVAPDGEVNTVVESDVYLRLDTQRERLVARGVRAAKLWPQWCSQNPLDCQ